LLTTCAIDPLLALTLDVPLYSAVMVCVPAGNTEVVKLAWPLALTVIGPARTVVPSLNVTLPVLTGAPPETTVAVSVAACPKVDGFSDEASVAVVSAVFTVCAMDPLLALKLDPPLYSAVMLWPPTVNVAVLKVALPAASTGTGPASMTGPSLNVIVPCDTPTELAVTAAVSVTAWP